MEGSLPERIKQSIFSVMPDASVRVRDMTGGGDHFEIEVVSDSFEGQPLLERHRRLHAILEGLMQGGLHAVKFKTLTPSQARQRG